MIKERIFNGLRIFEISANGDDYEIFKRSVAFFERQNIILSKRISGFETEYFSFKYLNTFCEIIYSGFFGTELQVSFDSPKTDLLKIQQCIEEILDTE